MENSTKVAIFGYSQEREGPKVVYCVVKMPRDHNDFWSVLERIAAHQKMWVDDLVTTMEGDELFNELNLNNVLWDEMPVFDESVPEIP